MLSEVAALQDVVIWFNTKVARIISLRPEFGAARDRSAEKTAALAPAGTLQNISLSENWRIRGSPSVDVICPKSGLVIPVTGSDKFVRLKMLKASNRNSRRPAMRRKKNASLIPKSELSMIRTPRRLLPMSGCVASGQSPVIESSRVFRPY